MVVKLYIKMKKYKLKNFFKNYWWTIPLGIIVFISLYCIYLTISYYWLQFQNTTITNNPVNWGLFGEYFGGTLNPLLLLINICITIWLTIIINKYAKQNSDKQIEAARKVVEIQLKHEALKEFREELNYNFNNLRKDINNVAKVNACMNVLQNFANNFNYLFTFSKIDSFNSLLKIINHLEIIVVNGDIADSLQTFKQADAGRITLFSEIGEKTINL